MDTFPIFVINKFLFKYDKKMIVIYDTAPHASFLCIYNIYLAHIAMRVYNYTLLAFVTSIQNI